MGVNTMSKRRQERMSVEVQRVLSRIIREDIKDPRIDINTVSIPRVDVSGDLSHARVNISVLGDEVKQAATMKGLQQARGYIRTELARALQVKHAPELEFRLDMSIEHGIRMSGILEDIGVVGPEEDKTEKE